MLQILLICFACFCNDEPADLPVLELKLLSTLVLESLALTFWVLVILAVLISSGAKRIVCPTAMLLTFSILFQSFSASTETLYCLAIENKRRKAKGMELLTELKSSDKKKEDDKAKEGEEKESKDKEEDDKEPDALLLETGKILTDLMELNNIPTTKTQQVKHQQ